VLQSKNNFLIYKNNDMVLPIWMITFMKYRFPVGIFLFLAGIALTFVIGAEWSWLFWVPGLVFILTHLFIGTGATASQLLQMGDIAGAEAMLAKTINPKWLYSMFRSNYYAVQGMIAMSKNDLVGAEESMKYAASLGSGSGAEQATMLFSIGMTQMQQQKIKEGEASLRRASQMGLPDEQEAIVQLNFAFLALQRGNVNGAKAHAQKCRDLKPDNEEIKKNLADLDRALKQSGQFRNSTMAVRQQQQNKMRR
jgi:tetratricopeptide (TPR) repeat protein